MTGNLLRCSLAVALGCACGTVKGLGADVAEVSYCEVESCGEVYLCQRDGSAYEWCWMDDNPGELARAAGATSCVPTPRGGVAGWPCLYQCPSKRGCNAYQGCFCGP